MAVAVAARAESHDDALTRRRYRKLASLSVPCRLSLAGGVAFFGPGMAGVEAPPPPPSVEARPAPGYRDIFSPGTDWTLAFDYRFCPAMALHAEAGLCRLEGRNRGEGYLGEVRYDPLLALSLMVGFHLDGPCGLPLDTWFQGNVAPPIRGIAPFLEAGFGLCHANRVAHDPHGGYWRSGTVFCAALSLGLAFGFDLITLFAEGEVRYVSEPLEAVWYAEADAALLFAFRGGVRMDF